MRLNILLPLFRNTIPIYKSESILKQNFSLKKNFLKKELCDVVDYIIGIKMFITL